MNQFSYKSWKFSIDSPMDLCLLLRADRHYTFWEKLSGKTVPYMLTPSFYLADNFRSKTEETCLNNLIKQAQVKAEDFEKNWQKTKNKTEIIWLVEQFMGLKFNPLTTNESSLSLTELAQLRETAYDTLVKLWHLNREEAETLYFQAKSFLHFDSAPVTIFHVLEALVRCQSKRQKQLIKQLQLATNWLEVERILDDFLPEGSRYEGE